MSTETNQSERCCIDCGAKGVSLDEDGVCNSCRITRELDNVRKQSQSTQDILSRRRSDIWE